MTRRSFIRAILGAVAAVCVTRHPPEVLLPCSFTVGFAELEELMNKEVNRIAERIVASLLRPSPFLALIESAPFPENAGGAR